MEIEKGIPIPGRSACLRTNKYDFLKKMEIGDSVLVTDPELRRTLDKHARVYAERAGIKIATRKMSEGVRLWRIE